MADVELSPAMEDFLDRHNKEITGAIEAAGPNDRKLTDYEVVTVKNMVVRAAGEWLEDDRKSLGIFTIEKNVEIPFDYADVCNPPLLFKRARGIVDISGFYRGKEKRFWDFPFVLDWKSSRSTLDAKWVSRLVDSWQWRMYAHALKAKVVIYRGISECTAREFLIEVPDTNSDEVVEYLRGVWSMRQTLIDAEMQVWPRHMPGGCMAYGRQCPFYQDCVSYSMPPQAIESKAISFSEIENFMICPERSRRAIIAQGTSGSDESYTGVAFHRGIAKVYELAYGLNN